MSTIDNCVRLFGTANIYRIFGLEKDASQTKIKTAFHEKSLEMHPDRVPQNAKKLATEKFQLMVALHAVLSNKEKRRMYDEKGMIDNYDANDSLPKANCKITGEHVQECKNKFKGSDTEQQAIRSAYLEKNGDIKYILKRVPFLSGEDESRVKILLSEWIENGLIPEYSSNTDKTKKKTNKSK